VKKVLLKIIKELNKARIVYTLVGGIASQWYGSLRTTIDIDISLLIDENGLEKLLKIFKKLKLKFDKRELEILFKIGNRFCVYDRNNVRIDFWLAKTALERQFIKERKKIKIKNLQTYIIAPENLILSKLLVGREKDLEDVLFILKNMLKEKSINLIKLRQKIKAFGLSKEFKKLWKKLTK
jgi:hypothetical protein